MPPFTTRTRVTTAGFIVASIVLVLPGLLVIWAGIVGSGSWDAGQRMLAIASGLVISAGFAFLSGQLVRQLVLGRPRVVASGDGLVVGSVVLPWSEIDGITGADLFGLPSLGVVLTKPALKRLPWSQRWQATVPAGENRVIFFSERQIGATVPDGGQRIWDIWSRHRRPET